jgi:hypothetical protein
VNHQEIRFEILYYLYKKHYGGELNRLQSVEAIIQETELKNVEKNNVYGDVVYLHQSGFIQGEYHIGDTFPPWITITSYGIDTVDNVTNNVINDISNEKPDEQIQIISSEPDPSKKISRLWDYVKANPTFFTNIVEKVLRVALGSGG